MSTNGPGLRKPRIKVEDPQLLAAEIAAANVLDEWMRRRGLSNVELAETWGVSESIVRDLRKRERPLTVGRVLCLPKGRARAALFDLLSEVEIEPASSAA